MLQPVATLTDSTWVAEAQTVSGGAAAAAATPGVGTPVRGSTPHPADETALAAAAAATQSAAAAAVYCQLLSTWAPSMHLLLLACTAHWPSPAAASSSSSAEHLMGLDVEAADDDAVGGLLALMNRPLPVCATLAVEYSPGFEDSSAQQALSAVGEQQQLTPGSGHHLDSCLHSPPCLRGGASEAEEAVQAAVDGHLISEADPGCGRPC